MTNELTVQSTLALFDTTKEERKRFVQYLIAALDSGDANALKIHYQVKCWEKIIQMLTDGKSDISRRYKQFVLAEAEKHGKRFEYSNAEVEIKELGTQYDWSVCGDDDLYEDMNQLQEISLRVKQRQEFLKCLPESGLTEVDRKTGEVRTIYPPSKTSTTGVQITLK